MPGRGSLSRERPRLEHSLNPLILLGILSLLATLLVFLGLWQRKIADVQRQRVVADIREAKELGTDRPVAQHPQIDEQNCIGCGSCIDACPEEGVLGLVDGIARVVHGSQCIGHALCKVVCPVAAVKVGLGDLAHSPDIPRLSDRLETSVPGVYIAGELGGFALIRNAANQATTAIQNIAQDLEARQAGAKRNSPDKSETVDVLIVGAGPAGFAASLAAVECGLSYRTIDQADLGGTVRKYPRRKLTITGELTLPLYGKVKRKEFLKEELIELWEQITREFELKIESGVKFHGARRHAFEGQNEELVLASTSLGEIRCRRLLLALGRRGTPRKLGVPGEDMEQVLYHLVDAASYANEQILVVGGGDSAVEAATGLANQSGNAVTLSYRRSNFFRIKKRNLERIQRYAQDGKVRLLLDSRVERIAKDSVVLKVKDDGVERTVELNNDYVFVFAGGEPPYTLLKNAGIRFGTETQEAEQQVSNRTREGALV